MYYNVCSLSLNLGYISSPWTIQPFDEPEIASADQPAQQRMRQFNIRLSSERIRVEHAFGKLKGCFPSLKEMGCHKKIQEMYKVIEALLILHNMCIDYGDVPEHIFDFDPTDNTILVEVAAGDIHFGLVDVTEEADIPWYETDQWIKEEGRCK